MISVEYQLNFFAMLIYIINDRRLVCVFVCPYESCVFSVRFIQRGRETVSILNQDPAHSNHISGTVQCLYPDGSAQHSPRPADRSLVSFHCFFLNHKSYISPYHIYRYINYYFFGREKFTAEPRILLGIARLYDMLHNSATSIGSI
jgi:hypothetical protein